MADPLDDMVEAGAQALGIPLDMRWTAEVKAQLQVILRHGALVAEFPLPDELEPAPVFKA
jgi:1-carboxybiuret hydrolase subunit AtzG-like protein